jgi:hypothetical protein
MNAVYKTPLDPEAETQIVQIQHGAQPLKLDYQKGFAMIWWLVDPREPLTSRKIRVVGTGWAVELLRKEAYIGTLYNGPFVWHYFEDAL